MAAPVSPERTRIPVEDSRPDPDPARTGCLWAGGILGVIAGVVFVFFGTPPLLNFLFPGETVEAGETFENDKLSLSVELVERVAPDSQQQGVRISLNVVAKSSWSLDEVLFVLETTTGSESESRPPTIDGHEVDRVPQGNWQIVLIFDRGPPGGAGGVAYLHVSEPNVKFNLSGMDRP